MEGSLLSERDLMRTHADTADAIMLLADRFSASARNEDLQLQFQVSLLRMAYECSGSCCESIQAAACLFQQQFGWPPCCMPCHSTADACRLSAPICTVASLNQAQLATSVRVWTESSGS